jgi:hypothetical protein
LEGKVTSVGRIDRSQVLRLMETHVFCSLVVVLLLLRAVGIVAEPDQPIVLNCSVFAASAYGATVDVDVAAGATVTASCRSGVSDPSMRLPSSSLTIRFRCGVDSTLIFDGWRQVDGALEIVPPNGANVLEGVRVETKNRIVVQATSGNALCFAARTMSGCSLLIGESTIIRGSHAVASFVGSSSTALTVFNCSIRVEADSVVTTTGYGAVAVVIGGASGDGTVNLTQTVMTVKKRSIVRAMATLGRKDFVAAAGAVGTSLIARECEVTVVDSTIEANGQYAVTSVGFAAFGLSKNAAVDSSIQAHNTRLRATSSSVTAQGTTAISSVGVACFTSSEHQALSAVLAPDATFIAVNSNVTAVGAGGNAIAGVGCASLASAGSTMRTTTAVSTVRAEGATLSAVHANITVRGNTAASVGIASRSDGDYSTSIISADGVLVSSVNSHIAAVASGGDVAASVGFTSYVSTIFGTGSAAGYISADNATMQAIESTIRAEVSSPFGRAAAAVAVSNTALGVMDLTRTSVRLVGATLVVCGSRLTVIGTADRLSAAGVYSTSTLVMSNTTVSIMNSALDARSIASFSATPVTSQRQTLSNRLLLIDSQLFSEYGPLPSACANVKNLSVFDGILLANVSFNCSAVGWTQYDAGGMATAVLLRGAAVSNFPGASNNETQAAGSLGTVAEARLNAASTCAFRAQIGVDRDAGRTLTPTRPVSPSRSPSPSPSLFTRTLSDAAPTTLSLSHATTSTASSLLDDRPIVDTKITSTSRAHWEDDPSVPSSTVVSGLTRSPSLSFTVHTLPQVEQSLPHNGAQRLLPTTVVAGATGATAVVSAVAGLVGMPVASRPAVVGAAVRLSSCVADGDGPNVPPYEAMPVQFAVLDTPAATAGLATATNAAFVVLCMAVAYGAAERRNAAVATRHGDVSIRTSLVHVAATVPLSYIGPALVEFSVSWLTAAAAGATSGLGAWCICFGLGLCTSIGGWALLTHRSRPVMAAAAKEASTTASADAADGITTAAPNVDGQSLYGLTGRWVGIVGPLIEATRDAGNPIVRYAFSVELGSGLLFSAFSGVRVGSLCIAKCVAATLVTVLFVGYLVAVRPAADRKDHCFGLAFAVLQAVTAVLITAAVFGESKSSPAEAAPWTGTALDAAQFVSLATLGLLVLQAIVGLAGAVGERHAQGSSANDDNSSTLGATLLEVPTPDHPSNRHPTTIVSTVGSGSVEVSQAPLNPLQQMTSGDAPGFKRRG